jgi:NDP-hexose 4-ketoreductase
VTRYLVLGASGFLGSQVHQAIGGSRGLPELVAVSRHPPRTRMPADGSWVLMDLVGASVRDLVALLERNKPDVVINCAGRTSGTSEEMWAVNTAMVDKLIKALSVIDPVPLVQFGSAAEYGCQPEGVAIKETALTRPVSDYGRTKLEATELVTQSVARGAIRGTVLRVFNPVGPRAPVTTLAGRAVAELCEAFRERRSFILLGPLWAYRDYVAASDVAIAALLAIPSIDAHPVLNVGRGAAMSSRSMVELLADAAGFDGDVLEAPGGFEPVPWQEADVSLLRAYLGWTPNTPIAQAVADLWNSEY